MMEDTRVIAVIAAGVFLGVILRDLVHWMFAGEPEPIRIKGRVKVVDVSGDVPENVEVML